MGCGVRWGKDGNDDFGICLRWIGSIADDNHRATFKQLLTMEDIFPIFTTASRWWTSPPEETKDHEAY